MARFGDYVRRLCLPDGKHANQLMQRSYSLAPSSAPHVPEIIMIHNHCPDKGSATTAVSPPALEPDQRLLLQIIGHAAITAADAKALWTKLAKDDPAADRFEEVLFGLLARRLLDLHADRKLCLTDAGTAALASD